MHVLGLPPAFVLSQDQTLKLTSDTSDQAPAKRPAQNTEYPRTKRRHAWYPSIQTFPQTNTDTPSKMAHQRQTHKSQTDRHLRHISRSAQQRPTANTSLPNHNNLSNNPSANEGAAPANPACKKDLALPAATPRALCVAKALKAVNRKATNLCCRQIHRKPALHAIAGIS